ncbi:MAG: proline--tRNA ligase [Candidatus Lokiarchaeota archaeon]|nr:proline--tRNA ligase [Candidatus Lokiarchaeota archaeon]
MGKQDIEQDEMKKLPNKEENFIDWLNEVLLRTDVLDYRYNLKGCGVWKGYGFKLRKNILSILRNLLNNTPVPHEEYMFPLLVPEPQFMKEAEHVKGFENEVYWVTHGGLTELDIKLALRPTSETAIYPMFALWIRSHTDLPLKTYQIVNTFRWEGKNTRPMLRVREITTFKEAHTVHATAEDTEQQIAEAVKLYSNHFNTLGISYVVNKRPKWDTFPGADYSIAFDAIMPANHKTLQIGTVHNLGQNFAKTFDITFENLEKERQYVYQTCYGISERGIAAPIALHGDDRGLVLPPNIAPIQIVIVPIIFKNKEELVQEEVKKIVKILRRHFTVVVDDRGIKPGSKFFHWEEKGVPIRIEIGPQDVEKRQITIVRRDTGEKFTRSSATTKEIVQQIKSLFKQIFEEMALKVAEDTKSRILVTEDINEAYQWLEDGKGIAEIPFCGSQECASDIEKRVDGLRFLGTPVRYLNYIEKPSKRMKYGEMNQFTREKKEIFCPVCSKKVNQYWTIARSW